MNGEAPLTSGLGHSGLFADSVSRRFWRFPHEGSKAELENIVFLGKSSIEYVLTADYLGISIETGSVECLTGLAPAASVVSIPYAAIVRVMARVNTTGIGQSLLIEGKDNIIILNTDGNIKLLYDELKKFMSGHYVETDLPEVFQELSFNWVLFGGFTCQLLMLMMAYIIQRSWGLTPLPDPEPVAICVIVFAGMGALWSFRRSAKLAAPLVMIAGVEIIFLLYNYISIIAFVMSSLLIWRVVGQLRSSKNRILTLKRQY